MRVHVDKRGWVSWYCPACKMAHAVPTNPKHAPRDAAGNPKLWAFNGDFAAPTISPSLNTWSEDREGTVIWRCHATVTAGEIAFSNDSTHALRGKHPLPEFPPDYELPE